MLRPTLEKHPDELKSIHNKTQKKVTQQDTMLREASDHKDLYLKHIQSLTDQYVTNIQPLISDYSVNLPDFYLEKDSK